MILFLPRVALSPEVMCRCVVFFDQTLRVATQADVRRIARSLPDTEEADGRFAFSVRTKAKAKGFAWVWMERLAPKKPRVANPAVLAIRVANLSHRDLLISAEPAKFFTEPHYNGFPAVLVRLAEVRVSDLRELLAEAWRCQAPPQVAKAPTRSMSRRRDR